MEHFCRGPCLCGAAACGPKCDCNCHKYDAYDCSSIIAAIKYFYPRVSVAELAGENRNELFRWIQKHAKALHEHMPDYLAESNLADDELDEDEYLNVPFDISERMGELEPNGRNVPDSKRKSPSPLPKASTPLLKASSTITDARFWKPPSGKGLCGMFGLDPKMVIRRVEPPAKKRKCNPRG